MPLIPVIIVAKILCSSINDRYIQKLFLYLFQPLWFVQYMIISYYSAFRLEWRLAWWLSDNFKWYSLSTRQWSPALSDRWKWISSRRENDRYGFFFDTIRFARIMNELLKHRFVSMTFKQNYIKHLVHIDIRENSSQIAIWYSKMRWPMPIQR